MRLALINRASFPEGLLHAIESVSHSLVYEAHLRSARRWKALSILLIGVERGVEALARLEAHTPTLGPSSKDAHAFNEHLRRLETRIDRELDRLTVERGRIDLAEKQRRGFLVEWPTSNTLCAAELAHVL